MSVIPHRTPSTKRKATRAASKTAKKATQAKAVQQAPKTAAAVWTGKRTGKIVKAAAVAVVALVTLQAMRKAAARKRRAAEEASGSYRATPTPASSQQSGAPSGNGPAPSDPAESATPPHGDKL